MKTYRIEITKDGGFLWQMGRGWWFLSKAKVIALEAGLRTLFEQTTEQGRHGYRVIWEQTGDIVESFLL